MRGALAAAVLPAAAALLSGCTILHQSTFPRRIPLYAAAAPEDGSPLRVGFAEADITPQKSVYLGGFGMNRRSTGVHSPLMARAMVIEKGGFEVALVGLDLLGLHLDDVEWVKSSVHGIPFGNVLLCSTHNHAGPDLMGLWGWYLLSSGRDEEVLEVVRRGVAEAVRQARARLAPARLRVGLSRLPDDGSVARNRRKLGWFHREVAVVVAEAEDDGRRLGTLVHFACHPEAFRRDNTLISSDMMGALCDAVSARTGAPAVFLNGALGAMVTPGFRPRDEGAFPWIGPRLDELVQEAEAAAVPLDPSPLTVRRIDVYMPVTNRFYHLAFQLGLFPRPLYQGHLRTTVGVFEIGSLRAASVPGEMEPSLAGRILAGLGGEPSLVLGLGDDELGYLMSREDGAIPPYRYERSLSPCADAGDRIVRAVLDLLQAPIPLQGPSRETTAE